MANQFIDYYVLQELVKYRNVVGSFSGREKRKAEFDLLVERGFATVKHHEKGVFGVTETFEYEVTEAGRAYFAKLDDIPF